MNLKNLTPEALRTYADQLEATQRMEAELFGGGTEVPAFSKPKRARASRTSFASGARKSIVHPNADDIAVLDAMLKIEGTDLKETEDGPVVAQVFSADQVVAESNLPKDRVKRAINFLKGSNYVKTYSRGRGTRYEVTVTSNDLQAVNPATLGDSYRKAGGPKVVECVRAVFNTLEPEQKVTPGSIIQMAQQLFPEKNLKKSSFGQVFTNMERNGEVKSEGKAKSRFYWRGSDKLPGAANIPDGFSGFNSDSVSNDAATDNAVVATA
jgi:hypothetical protein